MKKFNRELIDKFVKSIEGVTFDPMDGKNDNIVLTSPKGKKA